MCNPLGTSRKKHKLCAVYWILGNLPCGCNSALSSIYLALLCKSELIKSFGYEKVFEPLLCDLVRLEKQGLFVPLLGSVIKGTVQCVVADNLGAHGLGGFVENFSANYFCRFCTAQLSDINTCEVKTGSFERRTKENHRLHIKTAQEQGVNCLGVRKSCVLTDNLSYFNVVTGYPPDIVHDFFEGIVPVELAQCIDLLVSKRYFSLEQLNNRIRSFPYKEGDKTNHPTVLSKAVSKKKRRSLGGNAHENWCLIRLLPFIIGPNVPADEPAWLVILDLKDIVELVVAPVHSLQSVAYLECKVSEHRKRYQQLFPNQKLMPKHHFIEHYAEMIKCFGPLVSLWTMRFEAKHSFFKQAVRNIKSFRNIAGSLARKHQLMVAYRMLCPDDENSTDVTRVTEVPLDVLKDNVVKSISNKHPDVTAVNLATGGFVNNIQYKKGMIVVHGSCGGLPDFCEIQHLCIIKKETLLILKRLNSWYMEHYRAFHLQTTTDVVVVSMTELADPYPLCDYEVGHLRMVTLKRHIHIGNCFICFHSLLGKQTFVATSAIQIKMSCSLDCIE